jgi:uncharacterized protein (TIGR03067 family)
MSRICLCSLALLFLPAAVLADPVEEEMKVLRGYWKIVEMIDNGTVIGPDAVNNWLPAGGVFEFLDGTILFRSSLDNTKQARIFNIDPTVYPKQVEISSSRGKTNGWGVYKFDNERLVICASDPATTPRPTEFAARQGSQRLLLVLERTDSAPKYTQGRPRTIPPATALKPLPQPPAVQPQPQPQPQPLPEPPPQAQPQPAPPGSGVTARVLTDPEVVKFLLGTWQFNDGMGLLNVKFTAAGPLNGNFSSSRQVRDANTFHQMFVSSPVSQGNWTIRQGQLTMRVVASVYTERVNHDLIIAVRSISNTDLIYVDTLGRVGRAVKLQ